MPVHAEPTDEQKKIARDALIQCRQKYDAEQYAEARDLCLKAHEIMRVPTTALDLMKAYGALDQLVEARAVGEDMQKTPAKPTDPKAFAEARQQIDEAMEALDTRIPTLVLVFKGARPHLVRVTIDGKSLTVTEVDAPYRVNRGERVLDIKAPDYETLRIIRTIESRTAEPIEIPIEMVPLPKPKAPPPPPKLEPPSNTRRNWIIAGSVATGTFALASAGLGLGTMYKSNAAAVAVMQANCSNVDVCQRLYHAEYDVSGKLGISALTMLGASAALGTTTLVYAVRTRKPSDGEAPNVSLHFVPTPSGVVVGGTW